MMIKKIFYFSLIKIVGKFKPEKATKISYWFYKQHGMKFNGKPNYISSSVYFDGGNYSLIELGEGVTISSHVAFLTHDWAINTVIKSMNLDYSTAHPIGRHKGILIEKNVFIGRSSIILPGTIIGEGSIVGAGTVVRGNIPKYSMLIGSPCVIIGNTIDYVKKIIQK